MARIEKIEVFTFDELSDSAKEAAREWYRQGALDYDWWDGVEELAKTAGKCIGIEIDRIYFSGFWSQGDGACFEGYYSYRKGWRKALRSEFGGDMLAKLERFGAELQETQAPAFYKLEATVKHQGHYSHSGCTSIDVDHEDRYATSDEEQAIKDTLRWFMDWIYECLGSEYEWLMSDEQVDEMIIANGYEFTVDGECY